MRLLLILLLLTPVILAGSLDEEPNNADGANAASFTADQEGRHKRSLDVVLKEDGCPKYCSSDSDCCIRDRCLYIPQTGKQECMYKGPFL
uniref:Teretoxin Tan6.8 n=1 Tax=Terebra anilis TaxID=553697 RepID=T68_TERAN|nr:RecName: Full=Teretoxin Tan6.8; Flags: Precursor [Terebra anilis]